MKKVLIVEDDLMIADMLEEVLLEEGFEVCGIAQTPIDAFRLAEQHRPELAIIDVHLFNGLGTEVAPKLIKQYQTGILYTTGNVDALRNAEGHACLPKPFRLRDAAKALNIIAQLIQNKPLPPLPVGLFVLPKRAAY